MFEVPMQREKGGESEGRERREGRESGHPTLHLPISLLFSLSYSPTTLSDIHVHVVDPLHTLT